jgi:dihydroorotate dehydrogenase
MNVLKALCSINFIKNLLASNFSPPQSPITVFNLSFKNPVGLGAGFDKNAKYLTELECLGFSSVEIGTVTPQSQAGNKKPRLFRLSKDKALVNRMGFNNDGAEVIANRLKKWREQGTIGTRQYAIGNRQSVTGSKSSGSDGKYAMKIGGNIGKNKNTPNEDAWKDYAMCFNLLHPYVDYFVVNVSSPNTPGLRELQEKDSLRKILLHLHMINNGKAVSKPILLKIAPDLTKHQIDDIIDIAMEIKLDGLIATNTTISRESLISPVSKIMKIGAGGLSGKPLKYKSTEIVRYINQKTNGSIVIIASGGVFTGDDAIEKIEAGASLVQVWTGFVYEGPGIVKKICTKLKSYNIWME